VTVTRPPSIRRFVIVELPLQLDVDPSQPAVEDDASRSAVIEWVRAVSAKLATDAVVWLVAPAPAAVALMMPADRTTGFERLAEARFPERFPPVNDRAPVSTNVATGSPSTLTSMPFPWPLYALPEGVQTTPAKSVEERAETPIPASRALRLQNDRFIPLREPASR
jgi:hypothetical protein